MYQGTPLLLISKSCRKKNRPGICASFPPCNKRLWSARAHRVVCDHSKALQVITQFWKFPVNSLQLLCPLHSPATKSGKCVGCWAKECRTLRCEEGYAISSIFPLLSPRYNSPESQHIKKNLFLQKHAKCLYIYIKNSMHMSTDDITATEVIYMFQSPGKAAAACSMSMCFWLPWTVSSTAPFLGLSGTHCSLPADPIMERGLPSCPGLTEQDLQLLRKVFALRISIFHTRGTTADLKNTKKKT